jgi:hypothetical protein
MQAYILVKGAVLVAGLEIHLVEKQMGCILSEKDLDSSACSEDLALVHLEGVRHIINKVLGEWAAFAKGRSLEAKNIASVGTIRTCKLD